MICKTKRSAYCHPRALFTKGTVRCPVHTAPSVRDSKWQLQNDPPLFLFTEYHPSGLFALSKSKELVDLLLSKDSFKGTVAWDFCPLVLVSNGLHLGLCILSYIFFEFCFEFAELFEFGIRTVLWATAGNQIFLKQIMDLKLVWCKPSLVLFIYVNFLASLSL